MSWWEEPWEKFYSKPTTEASLSANDKKRHTSVSLVSICVDVGGLNDKLNVQDIQLPGQDLESNLEQMKEVQASLVVDTSSKCTDRAWILNSGFGFHKSKELVLKFRRCVVTVSGAKIFFELEMVKQERKTIVWSSLCRAAVKSFLELEFGDCKITENKQEPEDGFMWLFRCPRFRKQGKTQIRGTWILGTKFRRIQALTRF